MISPASFYNRWCLWWRQEVRFYTADDALQAELRGHHLALLRRFVPAYLASSLLGGGGLVLGLWGDVAPQSLLLWYGALVLLLTELTLSWRRQPKGRAAPVVVGWLLLRTLAGGLLWAAVMTLWYAQLSSASQQMLIAVICAALFAGACWHSPMPVVAAAWMLALIAGSVGPLWASGQRPAAVAAAGGADLGLHGCGHGRGAIGGADAARAAGGRARGRAAKPDGGAAAARL